MARPLVTIVWVNYNSSKFINLALRSLEGVAELDYPRYELVVVDNGSNDGSAETIKSFLDRARVRYKFIRLEKNYGFCRAVNVGFRARDKDSKYVAVLNNDAIPTPSSLEAMVEFAEASPRLGAVQGIVLDLEGNRVAEAGFACSEMLTVHPLFAGASVESVPRKSFPVTYASGVYTLYRVEALKRVYGFEAVYLDLGFAYFDDWPLGMYLWSRGYACACIPQVTARHRGSASFGSVSKLKIYLLARGFAAVREVVDSDRVKRLANFFTTYLAPRRIAQQIRGFEGAFRYWLAGLRDGVELGRIAKRLLGPVNISRVPLVRVDLEVLKALARGRRALEAVINREFVERYVSSVSSSYLPLDREL